jgi:hypothetical protein
MAVAAYLNGAEVTYHGMRFVDASSKVIRPYWLTRGTKVKSPISEKLLLRGNRLINSSVVVTAKILNEVGYLDESPEMAGAEDFNLWLRISKLTEKFSFLSGPLGAYRYHSNSFSNSKNRKQDRNFFAIRSFLNANPVTEEKKIGLSHLISARIGIFENDIYLAGHSLVRAITLGTFEVKLRALYLYLTKYQSLRRHFKSR